MKRSKEGEVKNMPPSEERNNLMKYSVITQGKHFAFYRIYFLRKILSEITKRKPNKESQEPKF